MAGEFSPKRTAANSNSFSSIKLAFDFESRRKPVKTNDGFNGLQFPIKIVDLPRGYHAEARASYSIQSTAHIPSSFYTDSSGQWLMLNFGARKQVESPTQPAAVGYEVDLLIFKVRNSRMVMVGDNQIFSPDSETYCRSIFTNVESFLCWSGPESRPPLQYSAFVTIDQTSREWVGSLMQYGYVNGLRWTFSPLTNWRLYPIGLAPPSGGFKSGTQAQFLMLEPIGTVVRTITAENIDLAPYIVRP